MTRCTQGESLWNCSNPQKHFWTVFPHWTAVLTTSVRIKNQKLSVLERRGLVSGLARVSFHLVSWHSRESLLIFFSSEWKLNDSYEVKYEVIVWRNLARIFLLWFSLKEFTTVHFSSQKNQEIKKLNYEKNKIFCLKRKWKLFAPVIIEQERNRVLELWRFLDIELLIYTKLLNISGL